MEANEYQITFRSTSGTEATIAATPVVRRDYADAALKPQLIVDVPQGKPGPTAITVTLDGAVVLEVPETDFTRLQAPIALTEDNGETISQCYRAAVATDGTVYFPLDVSAIGKRTIFSGAAKGYRYTFDAEDITIYNRQGILMQTLGPQETGIFTIEDDSLGDGSIHAEVFTGDPRVRSEAAFGDPTRISHASNSHGIDFDPSPVGELYENFDLFPDVGLLTGRQAIGTGVPASAAVEFAPTAADESAFGVLEASWRQLRHAGDHVDLSADVRFPAADAGGSAAVGIYSNRGGIAMFGIRPDQTGAMEIFVETGWGSFLWPVLRDRASFTTNWLRLSVVFTYTGDAIAVSGLVSDIGPSGTDLALPLGYLNGTFDNHWLERNRKIQRGFGIIAGSGSPSSDVVHLDNFADEAIHDPGDDIDVYPAGRNNDPVDPDPDSSTEPPVDGTDPANGPGIDPDDDDPTIPGTDPTSDPGDDGYGDEDPADDGTSDEPGSDAGDDGADADDSGVDETVKSFRLTYDRHEFLSYEAKHAMDPNYFLDSDDPEWHADASRHIDHDHLIIAVRGLVDGSFLPPAGQTPSFNLHLTTMLADAPLSQGAPPRVLTNDCDGDTSTAPVVLCGPAPQAECRTPALSGTAKLTLKDAKKDAADALVWSWTKGQATAMEDFGDPMTVDTSALCIYDESGDTPTLVFEGTAPAGGTCGSGDTACWRTVGKSTAPKGYAYDDADRTSDGIAEVLLKSGKDRKAKIVVKAKGENLLLPSLPLALPTRVQLHTTNGSCWEATYSKTGTKKNGGKSFKAKAD
jgi:hypothetical protein